MEVDKKKIKFTETLGDIYHKEKESEKEEEPLKEKEEILLEEWFKRFIKDIYFEIDIL